MGFESILNHNSHTGTINSVAGLFIFDVITMERHSSGLRVTENPIETGSNISDHAVLEPKEITITGVMVAYNHKPQTVVNHAGFDFSDYPLPIDINPISEKAFEVASDFANTAVGSSIFTKLSNTIGRFFRR